MARRSRTTRSPSHPRKPAPRSASTDKPKPTSILLRNLDPILVEAARKRAAESGQSLQHELHAALRRGLNLDYARARAVAEKWQAYFKGRTFPDMGELIREDRER